MIMVLIQNVVIVSKHHSKIAYQRCIKDHNTTISRCYQNLTVDLIFQHSAIHNSVILNIEISSIISKYHHGVEYQRCIKGHLIMSKYHDNTKISKSHSLFDILISCNPSPQCYIVTKRTLIWSLPEINSAFQFTNRNSHLCNFRTIDARLTTVYLRFSQLLQIAKENRQQF